MVSKQIVPDILSPLPYITDIQKVGYTNLNNKKFPDRGETDRRGTDPLPLPLVESPTSAPGIVLITLSQFSLQFGGEYILSLSPGK